VSATNKNGWQQLSRKDQRDRNRFTSSAIQDPLQTATITTAYLSMTGD